MAAQQRNQPGDDQHVPPEIVEEIQRAVRIGITFTGENILGEKLALAEVLRIVSTLNRAEAIGLCAEWNRWNTWVIFHGGWKVADTDLQRLLDELVPPHAQRRATSVIADDAFLSPFSEVSVLALVGLLCRYAPATAGESVDTRQRDLRNITAIRCDDRRRHLPKQSSPRP
jgi:hypothetical protein